VRAHLQPVEIERRRILDEQRRFALQRLEILDRLVVDARIVGIGVGG
jgi:hypothetical protein